jgi:hypothetical protein
MEHLSDIQKIQYLHEQQVKDDLHTCTKVINQYCYGRDCMYCILEDFCSQIRRKFSCYHRG